MSNPLDDLINSDLTARQVDFKQGDIICEQGDLSAWILVVIKGSCDVRKDNVLIATLTANGDDYEILGEVGLILQEPRTATVVASTEVKAIKICADDVSELFQVPYLCRLIMVSVARKLKDATNDLIRLKLREKLAEELGRVHDRYE